MEICISGLRFTFQVPDSQIANKKSVIGLGFKWKKLKPMTLPEPAVNKPWTWEVNIHRLLSTVSHKPQTKFRRVWFCNADAILISGGTKIEKFLKKDVVIFTHFCNVNIWRGKNQNFYLGRLGYLYPLK